VKLTVEEQAEVAETLDERADAARPVDPEWQMALDEAAEEAGLPEPDGELTKRAQWGDR
jgi:hypothetical protein